VPSKSSWTICKIYQIYKATKIKKAHAIQPVFSKNWCWVSNNVNRRSGPTFRRAYSSIHIVCKGHLILTHFSKFRENILFCSRTFGGHCTCICQQLGYARDVSIWGTRNWWASWESYRISSSHLRKKNMIWLFQEASFCHKNKCPNTTWQPLSEHAYQYP